MFNTLKPVIAIAFISTAGMGPDGIVAVLRSAEDSAGAVSMAGTIGVMDRMSVGTAGATMASELALTPAPAGWAAA
jgi:hypothetical protein